MWHMPKAKNAYVSHIEKKGGFVIIKIKKGNIEVYKDIKIRNCGYGGE